MKKNLIRHLSICLLSVLGFAAAQAEPVETVVASVKGNVEYAPAGSSEFAKLNKNDRLRVGSKVRTGVDGAAFLSTFPGAALQVGSNTELTLSEVDLTRKGDKVAQRKAVINVSRGTVISSLDPQLKSKTDFRINIPKAAVRAVGTAYSITPGANGSYVVVVLSGSVEVTANGVKTKVGEKKKIIIYADGKVSDVEDATSNELSNIASSEQVAIALKLLQERGVGDTDDSDFDTANVGLFLDDTLSVVNGANIRGEASPR